MGEKGIAVRTEGLAVASFGTVAPEAMLQKATEAAKVLGKMIEDRKLYAKINNKKYVQVEGWTTLGAMLGVFPQVEYVIRMDGGVEGYVARVEIHTLDGKVISSGIASCGRDESKWATSDDYAMRSMAQTRATSKAMRLALSWVMALAGYEPTPAEEIPDGNNQPAADPATYTGNARLLYDHVTKIAKEAGVDYEGTLLTVTEFTKKDKDTGDKVTIRGRRRIEDLSDARLDVLVKKLKLKPKKPSDKRKKWYDDLGPYTQKRIDHCKSIQELDDSQWRELYKEVDQGDMTEDEIAVAMCKRADELAA